MSHFLINETAVSCKQAASGARKPRETGTRNLTRSRHRCVDARTAFKSCDIVHQSFGYAFGTDASNGCEDCPCAAWWTIRLRSAWPIKIFVPLGFSTHHWVVHRPHHWFVYHHIAPSASTRLTAASLYSLPLTVLKSSASARGRGQRKNCSAVFQNFTRGMAVILALCFPNGKVFLKTR